MEAGHLYDRRDDRIIKWYIPKAQLLQICQPRNRRIECFCRYVRESTTKQLPKRTQVTDVAKSRIRYACPIKSQLTQLIELAELPQAFIGDRARFETQRMK